MFRVMEAAPGDESHWKRRRWSVGEGGRLVDERMVGEDRITDLNCQVLGIFLSRAALDSTVENGDKGNEKGQNKHEELKRFHSISI